MTEKIIEKDDIIHHLPELEDYISQNYRWTFKESSDLPQSYLDLIMKMEKISYPEDGDKKSTRRYPCGWYLTFQDHLKGGILFWKTPFGSKISRFFSDDMKISGRIVLLKVYRLLLQNGWYGEISDTPYHMLREWLGLKPIKNKEVIRHILTKNDKFLSPMDIRFSPDFTDSGRYRRRIKFLGVYKTKALFGKPCLYVTPKELSSFKKCDYTCEKLIDV